MQNLANHPEIVGSAELDAEEGAGFTSDDDPREDTATAEAELRL